MTIEKLLNILEFNSEKYDGYTQLNKFHSLETENEEFVILDYTESFELKVYNKYHNEKNIVSHKIVNENS